MAEIKKLKDKGQLRVKKEKPAEISIPRKKKEKVVVREIHHYHNSEPAAPAPAPAPPKTPRQPKPPKPPAMIFA